MESPGSAEPAPPRELPGVSVSLQTDASWLRGQAGTAPPQGRLRSGETRLRLPRRVSLWGPVAQAASRSRVFPQKMHDFGFTISV